MKRIELRFTGSLCGKVHLPLGPGSVGTLARELDGEGDQQLAVFEISLRVAAWQERQPHAANAIIKPDAQEVFPRLDRFWQNQTATVDIQCVAVPLAGRLQAGYCRSVKLCNAFSPVVVHVDVGDPVVDYALASFPEEAQRGGVGRGQQIVALQLQAVIGRCRRFDSGPRSLHEPGTNRRYIKNSQM